MTVVYDKNIGRWVATQGSLRAARLTRWGAIRTLTNLLKK